MVTHAKLGVCVLFEDMLIRSPEWLRGYQRLRICDCIHVVLYGRVASVTRFRDESCQYCVNSNDSVR